MIPYPNLLRQFIPAHQLNLLRQLCDGPEEGKYFRDKLRKVADLIMKMPTVYQQQSLGDKAIVYLHYFTGSCDWFILEKDSEEIQLQAFGLAKIHVPELSYVNLTELVAHPRVELDLYFEPRTLKTVKENLK